MRLELELAISANDFLEDVIGFGGPDEGFGILIVRSDVRFKGGDQFWNAAEEALDHVEP